MTRLLQLVHLSDILFQSGGLHALLSWRPFSITSFRMMGTLARDGLVFNTIIDGGANKGQFARAATETYPDAQLIAFEPLPDIAEKLQRNLADRPQVKILQSAVGNRDGTIDFYRSSYSLSSSILKPLHASGQDDVEKVSVPICRLDSALQQIILRPPILLKLDLQGYEMEALKGASNVLHRMDYVLIESSFEQSYAGEPIFREMLDYMKEQGFIFLRPVDVLRNGHDKIVQMDALFARNVGVEDSGA